MSQAEQHPPEAIESEEQPDRLGWAGCLARLFLPPAVLMVLYVLSIGPLFWQWHAAYYMDGNKGIVLLYMPLLLLCEIDAVGEAVNWYIRLWIV